MMADVAISSIRIVQLVFVQLLIPIELHLTASNREVEVVLAVVSLLVSRATRSKQSGRILSLVSASKKSSSALIPSCEAFHMPLVK